MLTDSIEKKSWLMDLMVQAADSRQPMHLCVGLMGAGKSLLINRLRNSSFAITPSYLLSWPRFLAQQSKHTVELHQFHCQSKVLTWHPHEWQGFIELSYSNELLDPKEYHHVLPLLLKQYTVASPIICVINCDDLAIPSFSLLKELLELVELLKCHVLAKDVVIAFSHGSSELTLPIIKDYLRTVHNEIQEVWDARFVCALEFLIQHDSCYLTDPNQPEAELTQLNSRLSTAESITVHMGNDRSLSQWILNVAESFQLQHASLLHKAIDNLRMLVMMLTQLLTLQMDSQQQRQKIAQLSTITWQANDTATALSGLSPSQKQRLLPHGQTLLRISKYIHKKQVAMIPDMTSQLRLMQQKADLIEDNAQNFKESLLATQWNLKPVIPYLLMLKELCHCFGQAGKSSQRDFNQLLNHYQILSEQYADLKLQVSRAPSR